MSATDRVAALREMLGQGGPRPPGAAFFTLGAAQADGELGGPLPCGTLHEIHAPAGADVPAAGAFALGLALRAAQASVTAPPAGGTGSSRDSRPILWVRQEAVDSETGRLTAGGLGTLGLDPGRLLLVRAANAEAVLRVAEDAARCPALAAVLIELWGEPRLLDLTATRRLSLRADESAVTLFLLRAASRPGPSAALTRWQLRPAPSRPLAGHAPGAPSFLVSLLRHRAGSAGRNWTLEWNHETRSFHDLLPLSRPVVSVPAGRTPRPTGEARADGSGLRHAG